MKSLLLSLLCKVFGHKTVYDGRLYHRSWHGVRCFEYYHCKRCGAFQGEYERDRKMAYVSLFPVLALLILSACGSDNTTDGGRKVVSLDLLGIMHEDFPCDKYLMELEDATEINLGYLSGGTFGKERECLTRIISDPRLRVARTHICSGPCVTNERCHSGECFYNITGWGDADSILKQIDAWGRREFFGLRNSTTIRNVYVSPVLEHQLDRATFNRAADLLLRLAAEHGLQIQIVDNPLYPRESKYLLEVHNEFDTVQMPYLYSTDGYFFDPRVLLSLNQDALVAFEWRPEFNGLCTDGSPWVSPLERKCF